MLLVCALLAGEAHSRELSRAVLLGGHGYERPIDLGEYTPPADARSPSQRFEGRLTLVRQGRNGFNPVSVDRSFLDGGHHDVGSLPEFDFDFVADGGNFIPVRRGAIPGRHSSWEMILEPGRVWESTEDAGYARASLPFTLEERNENCMHNGVLTFLFRSNGSVSHAAWQISSETCMYQKFDAWGWLAAKYTPRALEGCRSRSRRVSQGSCRSPAGEADRPARHGLRRGGAGKHWRRKRGVAREPDDLWLRN